MTIEVIEYLTKELLKQGKTLKNSQGLRTIHEDFINNDQSQGYRVTFVDGTDDPNNEPVLVQQRQDEENKTNRDNELKQKAKDGTLNQNERNELLERLAELL